MVKLIFDVLFRHEMAAILQRKLDTTVYLDKSLVEGHKKIKNLVHKQAAQHAKDVARYA